MQGATARALPSGLPRKRPQGPSATGTRVGASTRPVNSQIHVSSRMASGTETGLSESIAYLRTGKALSTVRSSPNGTIRRPETWRGIMGRQRVMRAAGAADRRGSCGSPLHQSSGGRSSPFGSVVEACVAFDRFSPRRSLAERVTGRDALLEVQVAEERSARLVRSAHPAIPCSVPGGGSVCNLRRGRVSSAACWWKVTALRHPSRPDDPTASWRQTKPHPFHKLPMGKVRHNDRLFPNCISHAFPLNG